MEAFPDYEALIRPHLEDLQKYCFFLTKSRWDADDLFQDTLLKSLTFFLHTAPRAEVKPFLVRVARNLWIDECRKKKRRRLATVDYLDTFSVDNNYVEVRSAMEWLAERFPRRNIEIWLLFHYFGYTMREIANAMDCTTSAVKSVLFRTRELLRSRQCLLEDRKVVNLDVERWSRAIMRDWPHGLLLER
ncbi:RNA polymerase sigma factor [Cohnella endophytica]|uniref:RNA polymerase sigma factor n=1 Tax=Cohnella endophytica TaxID=2419778 RepID=A0A494Y4B4_9BACL|nr:RNA polymerase sigma factor [Cohnella endophytica]RKP56870.1 RNA polymerase sigma factor [Cohnella endophytica]